MSNYRIYSSATYTVFRMGPGIEILNLPSNETEWLQGDEATQLEEQLEAYGITDEFADALLSQYFGGE